MKDMKKCSGCEKELPANNFYKRKNRKCGLRSKCKECEKKYYDMNREKYIENSKQWKKSNPEKIKDHRTSWNLKNPEKVKEMQKKQYRKNPIKSWAKNTLRYHKRKNIDVRINLDDLLNIVSEIKNCQLCGNELDWNVGKKIHPQINSPSIDRINNEKYMDKNNIMIVCHQCNMSKGIRTFDKFIKYCMKISTKFGEL